MEILIMAAVMIWEYETVKCSFNKLTADLCLSADKCSESPGPTSAWCCWTSSEWIESASLPRWRRKSCSPTSIASCWTKRSERGWSSTETSVTNLINRSGCYSDKLISITYTRWGRTNNQKAGPEGGEKKENSAVLIMFKCDLQHWSAGTVFISDHHYGGQTLGLGTRFSFFLYRRYFYTIDT